jgi:glucokinase
MILAGDIGGTKSRLGLFAPHSTIPLFSATLPTGDFDHPADLVFAFLELSAVRAARASLAVAAAVVGRRALPTGVSWPIDADELGRRLGMRVDLVNDVQAGARAIAALGPRDLADVLPGMADATGTRAVVSAGTGLGEAALWWDGERHRASPGEGGSCSFAPTSALEVELYRFVAAERGHVSVGRLCSGPGLQTIHRFLTGEPDAPEPAAIAEQADADRASASSLAVDVFASIYGARAGDVALAYGATGGVYLGGGVAPKLLHRLREPHFRRAFLRKGGLRPYLEQVPVRVVTNTDASLIGAALYGFDAIDEVRLAA